MNSSYPLVEQDKGENSMKKFQSLSRTRRAIVRPPI